MGESDDKNAEEYSGIHDSDYIFSDNSENELEENSEVLRAVVVVNEEPSTLGDEDEVELDYAGSEEFNSCGVELMLLNR